MKAIKYFKFLIFNNFFFILYQTQLKKAARKEELDKIYAQQKQHLSELDKKHKDDIAGLEEEFESILNTELNKLKEELEKAYKV